MRYYKQISDNYIIAISTGYGGEEITESEYNEIMAVIQSCPHADGKGYKLRTDLTWEEYDLPPEPPEEEEITLEDALDMLRELGVEV